MLLVEDGLVGLNRPVSEYIPEFAGEGKNGVMVHHLLTHTSGLNDEMVEAYAKESAVRVPMPLSDKTLHPLLNEYLAVRYGCPLWKPPGVEMLYANFNFYLAGEIVRRVSGQSLGDLAAARIFQPLGMKDTQYCRVDVPQHRRAWLGVDPRIPFDEVRETERLWQGPGGLWTTPIDMAIFGQMFLNRGAYGDVRILSRASVAAMTRNQIPGISASYNAATDLLEFFPEASWGLGWSVHGGKRGWNGALCSWDAFEHGGGSGCYVWVDPVYEIVGVYFSIVHDPWSVDRNAWRNDLFTDAVTASVVDP
jgi:CubicO group peptidase (beta-lactamase class C family)